MPALEVTTYQNERTAAFNRDMENNSWSILTITGVWCFMALLVVAMRVYARAVMIRFWGWDDIATIITMVLGVCIWVCFFGESQWALGKHVEAITPLDREMYSKWQFAHSLLLLWAIQGMRISFSLFLLRLSTNRLFRTTIIAIIGFMTVYTLACWFTVFFACTPISSNWTHAPAKCMPISIYRGLGLSNSILGMITDAVLALIPIPIISRMELNMRTKICLIIALGLGISTVACGIVKTYFQYHFFGNADRLYQDTYFVWGALELYVGIIAACLVSLKPLIASFLDKAKSTLATTAHLAKSLHHPHGPKVNEKKQQQFDSQNFPEIHITSVHSNESTISPDSPMMSEKVPLSPLFSYPTSQPSLDLSNPPHSNSIIKASKRKHRPTPLSRIALQTGDSLEIPSLGGVITSPSPTFLPAGVDLSFFDLIRGIDPETLQKNTRSVISRIDKNTTPSSTARSSLAIPYLSGVLTSPSPTFLLPGEDLDFFNLIRGRDPETLKHEGVSSQESRRTTMASVPEEGILIQRECKVTSGDYSGATATMQSVTVVTSGEFRRRPSMSPSATSAYLCPPVQDTFRESQMFFHVIPAGMFSDASANLAMESDLPLSPMTLAPTQYRERQFFDMVSVAGSSTAPSTGVRERFDSAETLHKKED